MPRMSFSAPVRVNLAQPARDGRHPKTVSAVDGVAALAPLARALARRAVAELWAADSAPTKPAIPIVVSTAPAVSADPSIARRLP